jgi:hypothetical protein
MRRPLVVAQIALGMRADDMAAAAGSTRLD